MDRKTEFPPRNETVRAHTLEIPLSQMTLSPEVTVRRALAAWLHNSMRGMIFIPSAAFEIYCSLPVSTSVGELLGPFYVCAKCMVVSSHEQ